MDEFRNFLYVFLRSEWTCFWFIWNHCDSIEQPAANILRARWFALFSPMCDRLCWRLDLDSALCVIEKLWIWKESKKPPPAVESTPFRSEHESETKEPFLIRLIRKRKFSNPFQSGQLTVRFLQITINACRVDQHAVQALQIHILLFYFFSLFFLSNGH